MKIAIVLDHFDANRGGAEHWTVQFAGRLMNRGHEVHVVSESFCAPQQSNGATAAGTIHWLPIPRTGARLKRAATIESLLRGKNLDVIHDMGVGWYCDVFQPHGGSRRAAFERNLLLTYSVLRPLKRRFAKWLPRYREFDRLMRRQYQGNKLFLAISRMVERDFHQYHNLPETSVRRVYNGVDTDKFHPVRHRAARQSIRNRLRIDDDEVVFLIVAHNLRLKGLPALMRAFARLTRDGARCRLVVVGGKRIASHALRAKRLGISHAVAFEGIVNNTEEYYAAADAYVQPALYDPFGLVVLEAFSSGLPAITSSCTGASELIDPGRHGFVIDDPQDDALLAAAMTRMLDEAQRHTMGQAVRRLALEHSFDKNVDDVIAVYNEIIENRRRSSRPKQAA